MATFFFKTSERDIDGNELAGCESPDGARFIHPTLVPFEISGAAKDWLEQYIDYVITVMHPTNSSTDIEMRRQWGSDKFVLYQGSAPSICHMSPLKPWRVSPCIMDFSSERFEKLCQRYVGTFPNGRWESVRWSEVGKFVVNQEKTSAKIPEESGKDMAQMIHEALMSGAEFASAVGGVAEVLGRFLPQARVVAKYAEIGAVGFGVLGGVLGWLLSNMDFGGGKQELVRNDGTIKYVWLDPVDWVEDQVEYKPPGVADDEEEVLHTVKERLDDSFEVIWERLDKEVYFTWMLQMLRHFADFLSRFEDENGGTVILEYTFDFPPFDAVGDPESYWHEVYNEFQKYAYDILMWALNRRLNIIERERVDVPEPPVVNVEGLTDESFERTMRMTHMIPVGGFAPDKLPEHYAGQVPILALIEAREGDINDKIEDFYEDEDF